MVKVNLADKDRAMTHIILTNRNLIDSCTTKEELLNKISILFNNEKLNTKATRRLMFNITRSKDFKSALQAVYNSVLCGSGMAVI